MDKAKTNAFRAVILPSTQNIKEKYFTDRKITKNFAFALFGFLFGRIIVFQFMNPAAIPYLACFLGKKQPYFIVLASIVFGMSGNIGSIALLEYSIAFIVLTIAQIVYFDKKKNIKIHIKGIAASFSVLVGGLVSAALNNFSLYFTVVAIIEVIVVTTLTQIFQIVVTYIDSKEKKILSNELFISISVFAGICFAGLSNIAIKDIPIRDIFAMSSVMIVSYSAGTSAGAAAGLVIGIIMTIASGYYATYIGVLGIAGMMAGIAKEFGKTATAAGFAIGGCIVYIYLNSKLVDAPFIFTLGLSAALFIIIPSKYLDKIKVITGIDSKIDKEDYVGRITEITGERLKEASKSFAALAKMFDNKTNQAKGEEEERKNAAKLVDQIAHDVCKDCSRFADCWKNNFYATYQLIFNLFGTCEERGYTDIKDLPESFYNNCINIKKFVEEINNTFNRAREDLKWKEKINESRLLVFEQLTGVSKIMGQLSKEFKNDIVFRTEIEKGIVKALELNEIAVKSVMVLENKDGRFEVDLLIENCGIRKTCDQISKILSEVSGRKMSKSQSGCDNYSGRSNCAIRFVEENRFNISVGMSSETKGYGKVSGDNFTNVKLNDGRYLIALSDGMGSGEKAGNESLVAIEAIEQFIESGFDIDLAIKMINSALILRSNEEIFSTLDLMCIDLHTGHAESVKTGAVETFLLRDGTVDILRSSSLPVGILSQLDIEPTSIRLKDDDIIVMVSDGISDAKKVNQMPGDKWIQEALENFRSSNPQDIADYILYEAKKGLNSAPIDDMTVLVARIWEKI